MDNDAKLYIKDLTTKTRRGYLCARVMRKWNYDGNIPGGPVIYTGLVLTDEQGDSIYAQIPETDVERLGSALLLHEVYTLRKFTVRVCRANYVPLDAELMIQITSFTTVTPSKVPHSKFPEIFYNITEFKHIRTMGSAASRYIDVLGIVVAEELPRTIYVKGTDRVAPLKEVILEDLSGTQLTATLWDDHVKNFELKDAANNQLLESVVVLFCGCLPKKIFNKTQVNVGNASSWYINPAIEEAQSLYERLKQRPVAVRRPTPGQHSGQPSAPPKILLHKTLAEMNALDPYQIPDEGYKCTVTITAIPADQNWWYMGCEMCKKRLWNQGGTYFCNPCKWSTAIPLYKLQFTAADATGDANFFCYDVVARQIIRRNCDSLLRSLNNTAGLPEQMLRAIGRTFTFTVTLTDQSFQTNHARVYLVDSTLFRPQGPDSLPPNMQPPQLPSQSSEHTSAMIPAPNVHPQGLPLITDSSSPHTPAQAVRSPSNVDSAVSVPETEHEAPASRSEVAPPSTAKKTQSGAKQSGSRASGSHARKKLKYDAATAQAAHPSDDRDNIPGAATAETTGHISETEDAAQLP